MRKKCLGMAAILLSLQLTGCGAIHLTTQEKNVIAEYIANILLKHDKTYEPTLQYDLEEDEEDVEEPVQTELKQEDEKKTDSEQMKTDSQTKTETYVSVSSIYQNGFKVSFQEYSFYQEYPKKTNAILPVEASSGNTICVVKLNVKNTAKTKQSLDLFSANYTYRLKVGSDKTYAAIQSFLVDDIQYFDATLQSGESLQTVVMFEIPKKFKNKSMQLLITKGKKTAGMELNK